MISRIIALYLAGITLFGLRFRKKQRTLRDYFLADRNIPWWAIALSIVAAETSTLTIISIPGLAYDTNFTFLQVVLGYVVGRCHHQFRPAASLFPRRTVHRVRTDRTPLRQEVAFVDCRPIPGHSRRSGRGAGLRGFHRGGHCVGHRRNRFHRNHHSTHADLHLRGRAGGGDLDRRGADCRSTSAGRWWVCSRFCISFPEAGLQFIIWRERRQAAGLRFHARLLEALHVLGGVDRRSFPDHRQPRNRSIDCAAPVGGAKPAAVGDRAAVERNRGSLPVCLVSA